MLDLTNISVKGHVRITDLDTGEVLVDKDNEVLYGNMASALAYSLIGDSKYFLRYMAFGNGGAYVDDVGNIVYKTSKGKNNFVKDPDANLYSTNFVRKLSNESTSSAAYDNNNNATIPVENPGTNYEDILVKVVLGYEDSDLASKQSNIDNSSFVGYKDTGSTETANTFVFNEIGLYSGADGISTDPAAFVASRDNLMITHIVFHPVQKSKNRSLEIVYSLRIQMGAIP